MEPGLAVKAVSPNHQTAGDFPGKMFKCCLENEPSVITPMYRFLPDAQQDGASGWKRVLVKSLQPKWRVQFSPRPAPNFSSPTRGHGKGLHTTVLNTTALYTYKWLDGSFYVMGIFKITIKTFLKCTFKKQAQQTCCTKGLSLPGGTSGKRTRLPMQEARDAGLIPGSRRSSGEGNGNPL